MKKHHLATLCWLCTQTLGLGFGEVARAQTPALQKASQQESPVTLVGPALELIIGKSKLLNSSPAIERIMRITSAPLL